MTKLTQQNTKQQPDLRYTEPDVRKASPILKTGAILLCLLGGFFLTGGMVLFLMRLAGRGPEKIDRFTIVFDLVAGSAFLSSGIFLALLGRRSKREVPAARKLILRNDRQHHGAAMLASGLLAIVGTACFVGLIAAGFRDPAALWAGPEVKSPRAVYLFLEGLALVWSLAMGAFAVFSCRKFMDRAIQLVIDENGLRDHRRDQQSILWSQVADVKVVTQKQKATVTAAALNLVMKNGVTKVIDVFGLDKDHKAILAHTTRMRSAHRR